MKRFLKIALTLMVLVLVGVAVAAVVLVRTAGRTGSGAVEAWVGRQLQLVAGQYLNPTLTLGQLDYQYPKTVVLSGFRLTASDPQGGAIDILAAKRLELVLAEIPREGQPIRIERLALQAPEVRLVAHGPGDGRLIGFGNLLKGAPEPETPVKLSDVFQIRWIQLTDGRVEMDLRRPDLSPMTLDGLNAQMAVDAADPGWYSLDTRVLREPVFDLQLKGQINLDDLILDLKDTALAMRVGGEQNRNLPPQVQQFLTEYDVQGDLNLLVSGRVPVTDWRSADLQMKLELDDAHMAVGERRLPVQRLEAGIAVAGRAARIDSLAARVLGGSLTARGTIRLDGAMDGQIDAEAEDLRIEQSLRAFAGDGQSSPPYEGRVHGRVNFRGPVTRVAIRAGGDGELHIREGRLAETPFLKGIAAATKAAGKLGAPDLTESRDEADMRFGFAGDHLDFTEIKLKGAGFSLRGDGRIYFDQRLDLSFKGGPVEKIQNKLGDIGRLIAKVTDALMRYTVRGTVGKPEVGVSLGPG